MMYERELCPTCRGLKSVKLGPLVQCSCPQPDAVFAQQEKVAVLRGELGRLRREVKDVVDRLNGIPDKYASMVIRAARIQLDAAIAVPFPDEQS